MIGEILNFKGSEINGTVNLSKLKNFDSKLTSKLYSIKYVEKGIEDYTINKKKLELNSHEIIIVKPNTDISVSINSNDYNNGVCIYLDEKTFLNYVSNYIPSQELIPDFKLSVVDTQLAHFYKTIKLSTNNEPDKILKQFMSSCKSFLTKNISKMDSLANKETTKIMLWKNLEKSKMFILNNFHNQIKLIDIAESANMSLFHYQRTFKKFYKLSPTNYLQITRLKHANYLLEKSDENIIDITLKCGFNDVKYLKKCVKNFRVNKKRKIFS